LRVLGLEMTSHKWVGVFQHPDQKNYGGSCIY
jgi:hypothetical protein